MAEPPAGNPQEHNRFPYSAIVDRKPLRWPKGARVAVWVIPNIEHFLFDRPSTSITHVTTSLVPDSDDIFVVEDTKAPAVGSPVVVHRVIEP